MSAPGTALSFVEDIEDSLLQVPNGVNAYRVCLAFEEDAEAKGAIQDVVHARVLGCLIVHTPAGSVAALQEVVKEIQARDRDFDALSALGESFVDWFIRPFRKFRLKTIYPSNQPSPPDSQTQEVPKTPFWKAKEQALLRDSSKCIVTGKFDIEAAMEAGLAFDDNVLKKGGGTTARCGYIVPDPNHLKLHSNIIKNDSDDRSNPAPAEPVVFAFLKQLGYDVDNWDLKGDRVNSLPNVMTLEKDVLYWFDRLKVWFEKTSTPNSYSVKSLVPIGIPDSVAFTSSDPITLPLPSEKLLALHAICANVSHLSGATQLLDQLDRDAENLHSEVLASDGTSSGVLNHALWNRLGSAGCGIKGA
ncbi:hypothetical protein BDN72DRAFT_959737 [Pluteus cervinus]|uniref:Uncharacterized protein n=1 Tax=Pluteus cervinus TaxID=181527 RepID=A0ACD3ATX4_9AGAR|nr:hypothetical protein BDN72DRAFT_959737 [Pluteus cervinus]